MSQLHTYIESLHLPDGTSYRGDCPVCGKHGTFSVTKEEGTLLYQCFSNSCKLKGVKTGRRDIETLKNKIRKTQGDVCDAVYTLPEQLVVGPSTPEAYEWLVKHNAYDAYEKGLYDVYTDIGQERIVVPIYSPSGTLVNAGGRAWNRYVTPKFRIYNSSTPVYPIVIGSARSAVIVEDFASAAAVSTRGVTGVALLGTHVNPKTLLPMLKTIGPIGRITIALDKDATIKAIKLRKFLQFLYEYVNIYKLNKDIKDMTAKELDECLMNM